MCIQRARLSYFPFRLCTNCAHIKFCSSSYGLLPYDSAVQTVVLKCAESPGLVADEVIVFLPFIPFS